MIKRDKILVSLVIMLAFIYSSLQAQWNKDICPDPKIKSGYIQNLQQWRNEPGSQSSVNQVRIYFHICTNDDGSLPAATEEKILEEFEDMKSDFAPGNICFVYAGLNYIADAGLNHINVKSNSDAENQFAAHAVAGCLNIFYCYEIKGKNSNNGGTIGGITFETPGTVCLVRKSSIGKHTASHETGHCLGLFHTYDTRFGLEFVNGAFCDLRGDLMCDTKADPYSFFGDDCFLVDTIDNTYFGYCEDPDGNKNYDPPYNNIMSYWKHSPESFTTDQFAAMNSVIDNDGDIQSIASADVATIHDLSYNIGDYFRSAINSFGIFSQVEFSGAVRAGLFGNSVTILPGFHAQPQIFSVVIKATECNASFQPVAETSVSNVSGGKEIAAEKKLNSQLFVYPNPSHGKFIVEFQSTGLISENAMLVLVNSFGQKLLTKNVNLVNGKFSEEVTTRASNGVYFITLIADNRTFKKQIVITR